MKNRYATRAFCCAGVYLLHPQFITVVEHRCCPKQTTRSTTLPTPCSCLRKRPTRVCGWTERVLFTTSNNSSSSINQHQQQHRNNNNVHTADCMLLLAGRAMLVATPVRHVERLTVKSSCSINAVHTPYSSTQVHPLTYSSCSINAIQLHTSVQAV